MSLNRITVPKEIAQHPQGWLWSPIYKRMHQYNKMWSMVVCGSPGSGKSFLASQVAHHLDRPVSGGARFNSSKIFFTASNFAKWISEPHDKGEFCILDDAGLALGSRESMTKTLKRISKIFQSCRYLNLGVILTMPHFDMIDKQIRTLVNSYAQPVRIDFEKELTWAKFHHLETNPRTGKVYHHCPQRVSWGMHPLGYRQKNVTILRELPFEKPPQWLINDYETAKKSYLDNWNLKNVAIVSEAEHPTVKVRENKFQFFYEIVSKNKKKYSVIRNGKTRVDMTKIMFSHPDCSSYCANLVARNLNQSPNSNIK